MLVLPGTVLRLEIVVEESHTEQLSAGAFSDLTLGAPERLSLSNEGHPGDLAIESQVEVPLPGGSNEMGDSRLHVVVASRVSNGHLLILLVVKSHLEVVVPLEESLALALVHVKDLLLTLGTLLVHPLLGVETPAFLIGGLGSLVPNLEFLHQPAANHLEVVQVGDSSRLSDLPDLPVDSLAVVVKEDTGVVLLALSDETTEHVSSDISSIALGSFITELDALDNVLLEVLDNGEVDSVLTVGSFPVTELVVEPVLVGGEVEQGLGVSVGVTEQDLAFLRVPLLSRAVDWSSLLDGDHEFDLSELGEVGVLQHLSEVVHGRLRVVSRLPPGSDVVVVPLLEDLEMEVVAEVSLAALSFPGALDLVHHVVDLGLSLRSEHDFDGLLVDRDLVEDLDLVLDPRGHQLEAVVVLGSSLEEGDWLPELPHASVAHNTDIVLLLAVLVLSEHSLVSSDRASLLLGESHSVDVLETFSELESADVSHEAVVLVTRSEFGVVELLVTIEPPDVERVADDSAAVLVRELLGAVEWDTALLHSEDELLSHLLLPEDVLVSPVGHAHVRVSHVPVALSPGSRDGVRLGVVSRNEERHALVQLGVVALEQLL